MKTETLLTKAELRKALIDHIIENELIEIRSVHMDGIALCVEFENLFISAEDMNDIVKALAENTRGSDDHKQTIVITPAGELGLSTEMSLGV